MKRFLCALVVLGFGMSGVAQAAFPPGHKKFMKAAVEAVALDQVRLPLHQGRDTSGKPVWFVVTDASSKKWADLLGVNFSPKLGNLIDTPAVMHTRWDWANRIFPFTVDFTPVRKIVPGPPGVPCTDPTAPRGTRVQDDIPVSCFEVPATAQGSQGLGSATGQNSYSPFIQIPTPEGPVVLNAPHIENSTGRAGKVLRRTSSTVDYELTAGAYEGRTIHYVSFDSSIPILAALENITFAPAMNRAPGTPTNTEVDITAKSGLIAITNGPTGLDNPERQGITSAIQDGASTPLNIIQFTPDDVDGAGRTEYSPFWDIHLATWDVPEDQRTRQSDFDTVINHPDIDNAAGEETVMPVFFWGVNCPIVSEDGPGVFAIPEPT